VCWCAGVQVELTGYSIYQWLKKYMVSLNFNFPAWYPVGSTCKEPSGSESGCNTAYSYTACHRYDLDTACHPYYIASPSIDIAGSDRISPSISIRLGYGLPSIPTAIQLDCYKACHRYQRLYSLPSIRYDTACHRYDKACHRFIACH
jgi:hypothetical protein